MNPWTGSARDLAARWIHNAQPFDRREAGIERPQFVGSPLQGKQTYREVKHRGATRLLSLQLSKEPGLEPAIRVRYWSLLGPPPQEVECLGSFRAISSWLRHHAPELADTEHRSNEGFARPGGSYHRSPNFSRPRRLRDHQRREDVGVHGDGRQEALPWTARLFAPSNIAVRNVLRKSSHVS